MKLQALRKKEGFTLIELIIALVIAAVVATGVASFLGPSLTESGRPLANLRRSGQLRSIMENITSHYNKLPSPAARPTRVNRLDPLRAAIAANDTNGGYGMNYHVVTNGFVTFASNQEQDDNSSTRSILKVTISLDEDSAETLTTLFTVD